VTPLPTPDAIGSLIADFAECLDYFAAMPGDPKFELYLDSLQRRAKFQTASDALACDESLGSMHRTLKIFFRLARAGLVPLDQFAGELRGHAESIAQFEDQKLGAVPSDTGDRLWSLISRMKLTANKKEEDRDKEKSKLVSGTKTLNLLLPDLVVPIDRQYTGSFLYRYAPEFDAGPDEEKTFGVAFSAFRKIARAVDPSAYVGRHRVHASATKVIDNGVIGFVERSRAALAQ
jgi:hypothetical protein